jgi:hypothetical protein
MASWLSIEMQANGLRKVSGTLQHYWSMLPYGISSELLLLNQKA